MKMLLIIALLLLPSAVHAESTDVSLREYIDVRVSEQDRRVEQARADARLATLKAETATNERLDLLNEFRAQAADQAAWYATREMHDSLADRVVGLESSRDRIYGALLLVTMLGVANLVKLFWGK